MQLLSNEMMYKVCLQDKFYWENEKVTDAFALFEDCTDAKFSMFILENLHSLAIICVVHQGDVT